MVGRTQSSTAIATIGAHQITFGGSVDIFLAKYDTAGNVVWTKHVGGTPWGGGHITSLNADAFGNIYETHRSVWSKEELMELGFTFFIKDDISLICIISLETQIISDFKKDLRILRKHSKTPSTIALKKILIKIPGVRRAYHGAISREN